MYICICKAVTDSQILTAIENGVCTRKKLAHCLGIGKDCGKCNKEVMTLLNCHENRLSPPLIMKDVLSQQAIKIGRV
ncbi:BFD domain protein (2Fe-2S)-binding domain protein [Candidatus Methylobacter favarea]|uniref:Bacterioferritin-associated ferredoxin n=1 Tax=Candidatus Methylobacter favarea TaxID=2707345 RepID=A0A8S0XJC3_9GAMM|nr:(2Fe-2S)-binding protein [Candidatus Methylobacter favarea]CAA9891336.1 BFD domain protein (2Fe-2S)-binding domain protein [Candidatus Methylobacter favarea]